MITELALLHVREGQGDAFEAAFGQASPNFTSMPGYLYPELQRCIEVRGRYVLLVRWERLEDHTEGFRRSEEYGEWKRLLHRFYDPFPTVEHFEMVGRAEAPRRGTPSGSS